MSTTRMLSICLVLVLPFVASCEDQSAGPGAMRIGAILSVTGPAAYLGASEKAVLLGLEADRAAFNGFELDIRDSAGDTARARILLDSLAADPHIVAVIGPSTSAESIHLGAQADALQIPMLSLAANKNIVLDPNGATRKWVFKFAQNDDLAADRIAEVMRANGHARAFLLSSDDVFGNGGAQAFRTAAHGTIQIEGDFKYASLLESAEATAGQVPADMPAVVIWGTTPGPALIVKALHERGYDGQIYLSHGSASGTFLHDAGDAADGAYIVGSRLLMPTASLVAGRPEDETIRTYHALWTRVGSGPPSTFGGHAYDAFEAIIQASGIDLREMSASARRAELRQRLEQLRGHHGVTGTFSFSSTDHAGLTPDAFVLYRVENRAFVVVDR